MSNDFVLQTVVRRKKLRSRQYLNLGPPAPFDQRWASLEKSNDNNDMVKNNSKYKALTY